MIDKSSAIALAVAAPIALTGCCNEHSVVDQNRQALLDPGLASGIVDDLGIALGPMFVAPRSEGINNCGGANPHTGQDPNTRTTVLILIPQSLDITSRAR